MMMNVNPFVDPFKMHCTNMFELEVAQAILQTLIERQVLALLFAPFAKYLPCLTCQRQLHLISVHADSVLRSCDEAVENALSGTWPHFFAVGLGLDLILIQT